MELFSKHLVRHNFCQKIDKWEYNQYTLLLVSAPPHLILYNKKLKKKLFKHTLWGKKWIVKIQVNKYMCHISLSVPLTSPKNIRNVIVRDKAKISLELTWKKIKSHRGIMINKQTHNYYNYYIWALSLALDFLEIKAKMRNITFYIILLW